LAASISTLSSSRVLSGIGILLGVKGFEVGGGGSAVGYAGGFVGVVACCEGTAIVVVVGVEGGGDLVGDDHGDPGVVGSVHRGLEFFDGLVSHRSSPVLLGLCCRCHNRVNGWACGSRTHLEILIRYRVTTSHPCPVKV